MESAAGQRPNFTGYWRLIKHDNLDAFLKEADFPWVMRKVMTKYCSSSVDVILHSGPTMRVTTVNAKTSWTRTLQEGRTVTQRDPEGTTIKATCSWNGDFFRTRMDGGRHGTLDSWRHVDGGLMIVKTTLTARSGRETSVVWYLEELSVPVTVDARRIALDQKRVEKATAQDNEYAQRILKMKDKWVTPADRYLSTVTSDGTRKDGLMQFNSLSVSPPSSIVSPAHALSPRTSVSTLAEPAPGGGSMNGKPFPALSTARTAPAGSGVASDSERSEPASSKHPVKLADDESAPSTAFSNHGPPGNVTSTERLHGLSSLGRRVGSYGQLSDAGPEKSVPSATRIRQLPESLEAQLSFKLQEYSENRSLTSVLPVENPLASDEPELLEMSPEEAEGTQLKMADLDREVAKVALRRHRYAAGHDLCCCTLTFHSVVIPPYIRVWDL